MSLLAKGTFFHTLVCSVNRMSSLLETVFMRCETKFVKFRDRNDLKIICQTLLFLDLLFILDECQETSALVLPVLSMPRNTGKSC